MKPHSYYLDNDKNVRYARSFEERSCFLGCYRIDISVMR